MCASLATALVLSVAVPVMQSAPNVLLISPHSTIKEPVWKAAQVTSTRTMTLTCAIAATLSVWNAMVEPLLLAFNALWASTTTLIVVSAHVRMAFGQTTQRDFAKTAMPCV